MYNVIKAAIQNEEYKLGTMLERIRVFGAKGLLNTDDMNELEELARKHASVKADTDLVEKIAELERRIHALEEGKQDAPVEGVPAYVAGKWYYRGDECRYNGENYKCTAPEGVVCTWSPEEYPTYWDKA